MKTKIKLVLPALDSLPKAECRVCGRSLIRGLFTPTELLSTPGPRCRVCVGDINVSSRHKTRGLPTPNARELKAAAGWQDYEERTEP
jgi:hypothetical protein